MARVFRCPFSIYFSRFGRPEAAEQAPQQRQRQRRGESAQTLHVSAASPLVSGRSMKIANYSADYIFTIFSFDTARSDQLDTMRYDSKRTQRERTRRKKRRPFRWEIYHSSSALFARKRLHRERTFVAVKRLCHDKNRPPK